MLVRHARRSMSVLLAAGLALLLSAGLTACTGEPEERPPAPATATPAPAATETPSPTSTATPSPTPAATPSPTPTAAPTPSPAPSPTPTVPARTPTPTPTATPSATQTPSTTPTATPSPSPTPPPTPTPTATATPAPLITAEDLGIREVDTAEALAAAGLTHVRYAAGEEVPWDPGLFLLEVESGVVEGWVRSLAGLPEEERGTAWNVSDDIAVSPSNRFVSWAGHGVLHDRQTGRTYALDRGSIEFDRWWGTGPGERLLFRLASSGAFVAMDAGMQPVARFTLPPGERFTSPNGGYILVREQGSSGTFHLVDLEDETNPQVHTWALPWEPVVNRDGAPVFRIELLDDLVAFLGGVGDSACHVTRYDLRGVLLSDRTIPCGFARFNWWDGASLPRISPDGRLIVAPTFDSLEEFAYGREPVGAVMSIFDAATGAKIVRILGAHPAWIKGGLSPSGDVWLADSSGIIVQTRHGWRVAGLEGTWGPAPGWASPDDPDRFFDYGWTIPGSSVAAVNQQGHEQASLSFGPPSASIPGPGYEAALILWESAGWGTRSDALRVWTSYWHTQEFDDYYGTPPLEAVIEHPPFDDRLLVEVVVDTCLNVREQPWLDAPVVTCLQHGTVAETDDFEQFWPYELMSEWMHIRTDDGLEGWASAEYLRWHSDGVRLEETPAGAESATSPGPFTAVAVGGHRAACALTEAGEAVCWDASDPAEVETLPGRYIAIDADGGTTCAVTEDGEAVCRGSDESASEAPPGRYTAISTTNGYTCALTEAGEAVCWGSHSARAREQQAQEGDAESSSWPQKWMPDPPPGTYLAITVGHSYYVDDALRSACAAKASGGFVCWRSSTKYAPNEQGDIWHVEGDAAEGVTGGDFCAVNDFGDPYCASSGSRTAISRGRDHACAITVGGFAECWASGIDAAAYGALSVMRPPDPAPARYVAISTNGYYACVVTDAGEAVCWEAERNVTAPPDPSPGRYVAVSDGTGHTCALTEAGEAVCWGWNNHGQTNVPPGQYTAISAGEFHTCALTEAGEAVCWGRIFPSAPEGTYTAVSTGWYEYGGSACALTEAGEAICWGGNKSAEEPPTGRYVAIDVGERHSCALTENGEAVCWYRDQPRHRLLDFPVGRHTAIGVGGGNSCALTEAGELVCRSTDPPEGRYSALAVGWQHACALTEAGEGVCWVWEYSRSKDGDPLDPYADELAQPPSGHYVAISSSEYRSCAVTAAGEVVCWGDVEYTTTPRWLSLI